MKKIRPERKFLKPKQVKSIMIWYIILLVGILVLVWKMKDIILFFGV